MMESTLIFPLKSFLFLSHQVSYSITFFPPFPISFPNCYKPTPFIPFLDVNSILPLFSSINPLFFNALCPFRYRNQYTGGLSIYSDNVLLTFPYPFSLGFGGFLHVFGVLWLTGSVFLGVFVGLVLVFWTKKLLL